MSKVAEQSRPAAVFTSPYPLPNTPVPASLWRGILLVEPDVTLLTAETVLLTRSNYSVTPAFSQREIFVLRETKAIALAILSDCFGPIPLAGIALTVRKQWPLARILVIGSPESMLEDYLYDEQIERFSDPKQLLEDVERLYTDSWNQRPYTLNWDVRRAGTSAARSPIVESDPRKDLAAARTVERTLQGTPSGIRYRPSPDAALHGRPLLTQAADLPMASGAMAERDEGMTNACSRFEENTMKATAKLHEMGQSLWLDNITRGLLSSGTLDRYIKEMSVTGLTSNPTIFDHAIKNSHDYDDAIYQGVQKGQPVEELFFELAIEDLREAADLFLPVHKLTNCVDGWVSLEVSPLLANDTSQTLAAAVALHARAVRPNLFIKIPGTKEGLPAIEEAIFQGVPVNVTLLFSASQYVAAAEAYLRGIERRIAAGLNPDVGSVASLFVSRWDVAVAGKVPAALHNQLGIAVGRETLESYQSLLASPRCQRVFNAGARSQRLLFASTGTKDPKASDTLYVEALAAPFTVNTMPEKTLNAVAEHGTLGSSLPVRDNEVMTCFAKAGIDADALAAQLQVEGAASFVKSWNDLMSCIKSKGEMLKAA